MTYVSLQGVVLAHPTNNVMLIYETCAIAVDVSVSPHRWDPDEAKMDPPPFDPTVRITDADNTTNGDVSSDLLEGLLSDAPTADIAAGNPRAGDDSVEDKERDDRPHGSGGGFVGLLGEKNGGGSHADAAPFHTYHHWGRAPEGNLHANSGRDVQ